MNSSPEESLFAFADAGGNRNGRREVEDRASTTVNPNREDAWYRLGLDELTEMSRKGDVEPRTLLHPISK